MAYAEQSFPCGRLCRPPSLPLWQWRRLAPKELDHEALWLGVSVLTAPLALGWIWLGWPRPACLFRAVTACPCVGCGATRALKQAAEGHLGVAFAWNPLFMSLVIAWVAFDLYAAIVLSARAPRLRMVSLPPALLRWWRLVLFSLLAANWAWVIWHGN